MHIIDNFVAGIDTLGHSFLVSGKRVKSLNQWYNKENKRLQSIKDKQKDFPPNQSSGLFVEKKKQRVTRFFKQNNTLRY